MSQSGTIAGALLAAFIFWLAVNNRLTAYTAVLWGNTAAPKPSGSITPSSTKVGGSPSLPGLGPLSDFLGSGDGGSGDGLNSIEQYAPDILAIASGG